MIHTLQNKLASSLCRKIYLGVLGCVAATAHSQAQDTNATVMKPVVVTGSLIPTAETVGPAPVQTITAADIQRIGSQDVLDLVKKVSTAFAGNGNIGQTL